MRGRDPYRANLFMPKTYSTIETIAPRLSKALFGSRPFFPITAERDEFSDEAAAIQDAMDKYLDKAGFEIKGRHAVKMAALFGTAYLEPIPIQVMVEEIRPQPIIIGGVQVDMKFVPVKVPRFRFKVRVIAPWQVYPDPYAKDMDSLRNSIDVEVIS